MTTLAGWLLLLTVAWAPPEPPHLDLIQGLRQRGEPDLALGYLQSLEARSQPPLPAEVRQALPHWKLQVQIDLALQPRDLAEIERRVQECLRDAAGPEFRDARARLHFEYGELLGLLAAELRVPGLRQKLSAQAREHLQQAEKLWAEAAGAGSPQAGGAALGKAAALLLQARLLDSDDRQASEGWQGAMEQFERLARSTPPTAPSFMAQAWLVRCWIGVDDRKAEELYRRLTQDRRSDAQSAQRLVRFFRLGETWRRRLEPGRYQRAAFRQEADRWLAEAPPEAATPDLQYLRFCLATSFGDEILALEEAGRQSPAATALLDRALAEFDLVQRGHGPWAQLADERRLAVLSRSGRGAIDAAQLRTASAALLQARLAWLQAQETQLQLKQAAPQQLEAIRAKHAEIVRRLEHVLKRGVELADEPGDDTWTALQRLRFEVYFARKEWAAAIDVCLLLWRQASDAQTRQAAAVEALRLMARLPDRGGVRRAELAQEVMSRFPAAPAADVAREVLGLARFEQQEFAEAAALLGQVSPRSPRHAACQYYAALAYWQLHAASCRKQSQPLTARTPDRERAVALLPEALKKLESQPNDAELAVAARVDLAQLEFLLDQPGAAGKLLEPLLARLEKADSSSPVPAALAARILDLALRVAVREQDGSAAALRILAILQKRGGGDAAGYDDLLRELGRQVQLQLRVLERQGPSAAPQLKQLHANLERLLSQVEAAPNPTPAVRLWLASMHQSLGAPGKAAAIYEKWLASKDTVAAQQPTVRLQLLIAQRESAQAAADAAQRLKWLHAAEGTLASLKADPTMVRHPMVVREAILVQQERGDFRAAIEQWEQFRISLEPFLESKPSLRELYHEARYHQFVAECRLAMKAPAGEARRLAQQRAAQGYLLMERNGFGSPEVKERFDSFVAGPEQSEIRTAIQQLRETLR